MTYKHGYKKALAEAMDCQAHDAPEDRDFWKAVISSLALASLIESGELIVIDPSKPDPLHDVMIEKPDFEEIKHRTAAKLLETFNNCKALKDAAPKTGE